MNMQLPTVLDVTQAMTLGEVLAKSGFFTDTRTAAQAVVKVLAGQELGFGPIASMTGVHVIEGKPAIGAHLMASMIKRSGRYDYDVLRCDREGCELEFFEITEKKRKALGKTSMTLQEAVDSGLALGKDGKLKTNWARSTDDMLFARCVTKGYRRFCPDLTGGCPVYDPDELNHTEPMIEVNGRDVRLSDALPVVETPTTPEVLGLPEPRITEEQVKELNAILRPHQKKVNEFLTHFGVKALIQIPASRFEEAKGFFGPSSSPSASTPTPSLPATPAPAEAGGPFLSPQQFEQLRGLMEKAKANPNAIIQFLGIARFGQVPASWFTWLRLTIPENPDWLELPKLIGAKSFAELPPTRIEAMTRVKLMNRIDDAITKLNIQAEAWNKRLKELYGHSEAHNLTTAQLEAMEARMADQVTKVTGAAK